MSKLLDDAVSQQKDDSWTFQCPGVDGDPCGPWVSSGWPSKKVATARGSQHFDEHKGLGTSPSLEDFRAEHGLTAHENGTHAVQIGDLP